MCSPFSSCISSPSGSKETVRSRQIPLSYGVLSVHPMLYCPTSRTVRCLSVRAFLQRMRLAALSEGAIQLAKGKRRTAGRGLHFRGRVHRRSVLLARDEGRRRPRRGSCTVDKVPVQSQPRLGKCFEGTRGSPTSQASAGLTGANSVARVRSCPEAPAAKHCADVAVPVSTSKTAARKGCRVLLLLANRSVLSELSAPSWTSVHCMESAGSGIRLPPHGSLDRLSPASAAVLHSRHVQRIVPLKSPPPIPLGSTHSNMLFALRSRVGPVIHSLVCDEKDSGDKT